MTTQAPTASQATRTLHATRAWFESRRHQTIAALALYAAIAIGYFGLHVLPHLGSVCVCEPSGTDPSFDMWSLAWWPHALLHGLNPFFTTAVFAPDRVEHRRRRHRPPRPRARPGAGQLLFGPVVSYNLLMLAAPVLAAFFAFLLRRYITRSFAPHLVGGCPFGPLPTCSVNCSGVRTPCCFPIRPRSTLRCV